MRLWLQVLLSDLGDATCSESVIRSGRQILEKLEIGSCCSLLERFSRSWGEKNPQSDNLKDWNGSPSGVFFPLSNLIRNFSIERCAGFFSLEIRVQQFVIFSTVWVYMSARFILAKSKRGNTLKDCYRLAVGSCLRLGFLISVPTLDNHLYVSEKYFRSVFRIN